MQAMEGGPGGTPETWAYRKEKIRGAERNLPDFFGLCPTSAEKFFSGTT
jgi:hypothetical protein